MKQDYGSGLSPAEVKKARETYGANQLTAEKPPGILHQFFEQFKDFMIITLLLAAGISFLASYLQGSRDYMDPLIILAIVLINAFLGVFQEKKAEHSLTALKAMQTPHCDVLRDGKKISIPSSEVVPRDLVFLETGCQIPADGFLLSCQNLTVEESALTGEPGGIKKRVKKAGESEGAALECSYAVFSGTMVLTGRGICQITATGMHTQIGHIAHMLSSEAAPKTPLTIRLAKTGKLLGILALLICGIIFLLGIYQNKPIFSMFMTSVSLGVAAIPESLPALVTIMLSLGVERMAKQKAVIRHLPAVETLGSATVVCSDKTGTLTQNRMTLTKHDAFCPSDWLHTLFLLCNNETGPMEQALIRFCDEQGLSFPEVQKKYPRQSELPFDSTRKEMSVLCKDGSQSLVITKGAPEIVLSQCGQLNENGSVHPLSASHRAQLLEIAESYAKKALRVLAFAYKESSSLSEEHLIFAGFAGFIDPPRKEAYHAVACCHDAGILPVMITGDHKNTAAAIAHELKICQNESQVMTGAELDAITDEELLSRLSSTTVFARVTPAHKVRLVKAYQTLGNVVAMTGDGVNDAPALKAADIGCAMGKGGTDVAKGAADLVLMDDNFSTIIAAVREGRGIFDNIKKAIHFLLSCNIGEIMTIFAAILLGLEVPLLPVQLLLINLVTDSFPALCLGLEPPDPSIMKRKPISPKNGMFSMASGFQLVIEGLFIGSLALVAYIAGNSTMCFGVLSLSQLFHVFNMRSDRSLLEIGIFSNKKLFFSVALCFLLQISVMILPPLQQIFHTVSLSAGQWFRVIALSFLPIPLVEMQKRFHSANC